jgi:hypothetical protein
MRRITHHLVIDAIALLTFLAMIWTGLIVRFVLPPGSQRSHALWDLGRHDWGNVHSCLALGLIAVVVYHLVQHVGWIGQVVLGWRGRRRDSAWRLRRTRYAAAAAVLVIAAALAGFTRWAQSAVTLDESHRRGRQSSVDSRPNSTEQRKFPDSVPASIQGIRRQRRAGRE